jgi:ATP-dependent Clp protease protease subunit
MPIGVPRIIYCWGEELPAQWTDIYNFIFRRRMVFLMQYLDDELCNQICGLLINIHMEDRGKELEKKEIEKSGVFKNASKKAGVASIALIPEGKKQPSVAKQQTEGEGSMGGASNLQNKSGLSFEDLLAADEDLGITENNSLEDYTLQKITMEWLNWNAQFFDYSDEPYLFYLAEMLSKDFNKGEGQMLYSGDTNEMSMLMNMFKNLNSSNMGSSGDNFDGFNNSSAMLQFFDKFSTNSKSSNLSNLSQSKKNHLDVYSPFRLLANFAAQDYNLKNINPLAYNSSVETNQDPKRELFDLFNVALKNKANTRNKSNSMSKLLTELAQKDFAQKPKNAETLLNTSQKALSQRVLKKEYMQDQTFNPINSQGNNSGANYLDFYSYNDSFNEFKNTKGKQNERTLQEEEAKKVFLIINSFGGSVGNGITVHDALQFIKAGSLTLALGVAASAASLALAGGTIGERYVTEGCHVMIHQPEGGIQGQASDIWIDSQEIMKIRLDVAEIYSLATYRPRHKILRDLDRDFYLTATETIHYGLADEIATNEVMHEIIEMTSKVWDYHDSKQQRLLETRDSASSGLDTQAQN